MNNVHRLCRTNGCSLDRHHFGPCNELSPAIDAMAKGAAKLGPVTEADLRAILRRATIGRRKRLGGLG